MSALRGIAQNIKIISYPIDVVWPIITFLDPDFDED